MKKLSIPIAGLVLLFWVAGCQKNNQQEERQSLKKIDGTAVVPVPEGRKIIQLQERGTTITGSKRNQSNPSVLSLLPVTLSSINNPDAAYIAATHKIDVSGLVFGNSYSSISDGLDTISFSSNMIRLGPVPNGWNATWGAPPEVEISNPDLLFSDFQHSVTLTLTKPALIFGFELEPNVYGTSNAHADFYSNGVLVGSITRAITVPFPGAIGQFARLFAAQAQGGLFDQIVITSDTYYGFSIANVRYLPLKIVDFDIQPATCPNSFNVNSSGVLPAAILGTASFNVNDIDVSSIQLNGVSPLRSSQEDVGTPVTNRQSTCDCNPAGPDGYTDLTLKFSSQAIAVTLGAVNNGDQVVLKLTGKLNNGMPIEGKDCILVIKN